MADFLEGQVTDLLELAALASKSATLDGRVRFTRAIADIADRAAARRPPPASDPNTDAELVDAGRRAQEKLFSMLEHESGPARERAMAGRNAVAELVKLAGDSTAAAVLGRAALAAIGGAA